MKRSNHREFLVALAIAMLFVDAVCVAQRSPPPQENALLTAARRAAEKDDLLGIQTLEPNALSAVDANADRRGNRLILHLKSGTTKVYKNQPECETPSLKSTCQKYALVAHVSRRDIFIVAKLYYESAEYLLVDDDSGSETTLRNFPALSPSGNHVLVLLMNDEQVGFAVQVWRRAAHGFVLEWSGSPYTEGMYTSYELVRWTSENIIELREETSFEPPKPSVRKHFELRYAVHKWNVAEAP